MASVQVDANTRRNVLCRAFFACEICGTKQEMSSIHHRTPRGMGGSRDKKLNSMANLVYICGSGTTGCHGRVESYREQAYERGWLVRRGVDPETVPFMDKKGNLYILGHDGTKTLVNSD